MKVTKNKKLKKDRWRRISNKRGLDEERVSQIKFIFAMYFMVLRLWRMDSCSSGRDNLHMADATAFSNITLGFFIYNYLFCDLIENIECKARFLILFRWFFVAFSLVLFGQTSSLPEESTDIWLCSSFCTKIILQNSLNYTSLLWMIT